MPHLQHCHFNLIDHEKFNHARQNKYHSSDIVSCFLVDISNVEN